ADRIGRGRQRKAKESGGAYKERLRRAREPGRECPAEKVALGAHDVEVRRGPEVNDDGRATVPAMRGERIRDPVRPDLRGVVDAQTHPRFDARADDQSGAIQVTLGEACERSGEWWDHGPEHERVDVVEGKILARQKRI